MVPAAPGCDFPDQAFPVGLHRVKMPYFGPVEFFTNVIQPRYMCQCATELPLLIVMLAGVAGEKCDTTTLAIHQVAHALLQVCAGGFIP